MGLIEDINQPEQTPLHSTGMGEVAGADGSVVGDGGLSLEQRRQIDNNRKYIDKYMSSHIGSTFTPAALRHYKPRKASTLKIAERDQTRIDNRQETNASEPGVSAPSKRPASDFREPPSRGYDPYK